jgi:hypothetical protein
MDTASSIHPNPNSPETNLLSGRLDNAHDSDIDSAGEEIDYIDNPGDIVCETTPYGGTGSERQRVYYDYDGLRLVQAVDDALVKIQHLEG